MKLHYQIAGISCGGCISKIKSTLESHPSIEKVEISLNSLGETSIKMDEKLTTKDLQQLLNKAGDYTISGKS
jgi:copper chaperone CopZ